MSINFILNVLIVIYYPGLIELAVLGAECCMYGNALNTDLNCHICGAEQLKIFKDYAYLPRVASDCVPWRAGGRLGICTACFCIQNPVDREWFLETAEVYSKYRIYQQSSGCEQGVFSDGAALIPRSAKIFQHALPYLNLSSPGVLLDVGCANGELLRCFHALAPDWQMVGFEIDDKRREEVLSIPGVKAFVSGSLDKVVGTFNLITLVHVFEHLPYPMTWLENFRRMLAPDGIVLIQVPDPKQNPFNLLVADHCSHFIMADLIRMAEDAGYQVLASSDHWVSRELSIIIKPLVSKNNKKQKTQLDGQNKETFPYPEHSIVWLQDIIHLTKSIPHDKPRGIWGTAIAATWAYSVMDQRVDFFVDEDLNRIGQTHLGRPVYSPEQVPAESHVFIALTPEIAHKIVTRWSHLNIHLHVPPDLLY